MAEVLITLTIIGTVAALTMPTLISNHKKQVTVTKLKKFYSVMSQATTTAISIHGPMQDWDGFTTSYNGEEMKHWFDKYLKPYLNVVDEYIDNSGEIGGDNSHKALFVHFADGTLMTMTNWAGTIQDEENTNHTDANYNGLIHVNYFTNPKNSKNPFSNSHSCVDAFSFLFYNPNTRQYYFQPYGYTATGNKRYNRDYMINEIKSGGRGYCSTLIMYDGWQIKEDYPVKF